MDINELRHRVENDGKSGIDLEEIHELLDRIEAAERERDWHAERCEDALNECDALRAKIAEMERQEPVAHVWRCDNGHIHGSSERFLSMGTKLYALPGAKGEEK